MNVLNSFEFGSRGPGPFAAARWAGLLLSFLAFPVLASGGCAAPSPDPPAPAEEPETPEEREAPEEARADPAEEPGTNLETGLPPVRPPDRPMDATPLPLPRGTIDGPDAWARATLEELTLREKVGQMIMPFVLGDYAPEGSDRMERIVELVEDEGVGGVIVSVGTPVDVATKLNVLQRRAHLPLLVAADLETGAGFRLRGAVHTPGGQDLGGATDFPPLMAVGAAGSGLFAYEIGRITALEARAVGIHVPFAPVLDVNNNPDNPIINTRSFGEDPRRVAELGSCFVRGMQEHGALATGKHFPGHGDTDVDSHLALPIVEVDRGRLEEVELLPFREAVNTGMGAIMTAHIAMPGVTGGGRVPATLSREVLTGLLREEMGFEGLVFTDAMNMNAIERLHSRGEAAVRAVEAGADVVLMPPDAGTAIDAIMEAVLSGRIEEERIDASVLRILRAKESMELHRRRTVDVEAVHRTVGIEEHEEAARSLAEASLTLLRNGGDLLPLLGTPGADVLSVTYRRANGLLEGRFFNAELRSTYRNLSTVQLTRGSSPREYEDLLDRARDANLVVVSAYVAAAAYSETGVSLPDELVEFVEDLHGIGVPHVMISFGNPYLLREFPDVRAYLLAWGSSESSQRAAARALLGEVAVEGTAPTRITDEDPMGAGLRLGALANPSGGEGCP